MKTIKLCLLTSLLALTTLAKAQPAFLPDEIWYDSGENIYVQFCLPSVYQIDRLGDTAKLFGKYNELNLPKDDQKLTSKLNIELDEQKGESVIRYSDNYIQETKFPKGFSASGSAGLHVLKITAENGSIVRFYFDTPGHFDEFRQNKWEALMIAIVDTLKSDQKVYRRKPMILAFQNKDGQIRSISENVNMQVTYLDQIRIGSSAGLNGFKAKLLPSIELRTGLVFSKKGIYKDMYFLDCEVLYDFVSENNRLKTKPGMFVDLGYKTNYAKSPDKQDWFGVSLGYLVSKKSNIFDDNTWRLSTYRSLGKNIEVVSQLYFTDNFSEVFPGIGLHLSF